MKTIHIRDHDEDKPGRCADGCPRCRLNNAAPDLLAAAKEAWAVLFASADSSDVMLKLNDAVQKAEGKA